ncbi:uncharacterized protein LOC132579679 isoform X4 [Heteronotia binoei]|uniref:uncharacterized protein LOC132579679 isoform X4 n=1 Tax=Heteronotia binoei TaxID=13085 RepID=UPI00292E5198|nr:uncharacterized protein LOC132579679 isoform X4 [Heteronotia binoei]
MGKIGLCILLILAPVGGAFEGVEGGVSVAQPTEICPDTARIPDHPVTVAASDWAATPESKVTAPTYGGSTVPAGTTAAPGGYRSIKPFVTFLVFFGLSTIFWFCYNLLGPMMRHHPVRLVQAPLPADVSAGSPEDDEGEDIEGVPSLSSAQAEAPEDVSSLIGDQEDALSVEGLSSTNWSEPVVMFHRVRSGKLNDSEDSSPPGGDVLEL